MEPFESLYRMGCRTPLCWFESGQEVVLEPKIVQQTIEKSYHDKHRKMLEFQEGDHVFLRVTSVTGVVRALKSHKLTPHFISPYRILERVGEIAYQVALPPYLSDLHNVFHVSQLRKYIPYPYHVIQSNDEKIRDNMTYETSPLQIEDREVTHLRGIEIPLVKVMWGGSVDGSV